MDETPLIYMPNTKIKEIETNIKTDTFVLKLRQYAEKLLQWEAIYFSDLVTQIAGLSQLTYESEWYCFGEYNEASTPLNPSQYIRLEYAILGILKSIITEIKKQNPELTFKLQRNYDADEGGEMLQLIENEHISQEIRENIFSILEWHTRYLAEKPIKSP